MKTKAKPNWLLIVLMLVVGVYASVLVGQTLADRRNPKHARDFMRQKLTYSQNILEGLILENYELIITNGIRMYNMSQSTDWQLRSTDRYKKYSADYGDRVAAMIDAAREKKINSARSAYGKALQGCYDCHNYCQLVPPAGASSPTERK